jgi:Transposase DDE domain
MSHAKRSRRSRGARTCKKNATYRHPLTAAMADFLGSLLKPVRKGPCVRWTPALLCLCAVLMSWDPSPSLAQRFDAASMSLSLLLPRRRRGDTYQGFIKAMHRLPDLHSQVAGRLRDAMREMAGPHWLREGWCAFAADSSKFNCPRTAANEKAFGCASKKGKTAGIPQQYLTTLWHMGTGLPWAWQAGPGTSSERRQLIDLLPLLPAFSMLVADAGFVGYDLLKTILSTDRSFLIRVGSNVSLLQKLGYCCEKNDTVYLWPAYDRRTSTRRQRSAPLVLRLIRVHQPGKKTICLLTNVAHASKLSSRSARMLYEMRWGVEVFFRSLKQQLQHRKLRSKAPKQAALELHWAVIGIWMLGLLAVKRVVEAGHDPLSFSVALALHCVSRAAQTPASSHYPLHEQLALALKDDYVRTHSKTSRPWPRRKKPRPPGTPSLRLATVAEIRMAKEFHGKSAAA